MISLQSNFVVINMEDFFITLRAICLSHAEFICRRSVDLIYQNNCLLSQPHTCILKIHNSIRYEIIN